MTGDDVINDILPDAIILEIFGRIRGKRSRDALSLVCKRWLRLERFCRESLSLRATGDPDSYVRFSGVRFPSVKRAVVCKDPLAYFAFREERLRDDRHFLSAHWRKTKEKDLSYYWLTALGDGFPKLQQLELISLSIDLSLCFVHLAQNCTSLTSLTIKDCSVHDKGLQSVGEYCKKLQHFCADYCRGFTDEGLIGLAIGCRRSIKSITISCCAQITDSSLEAMASHCKSLQSLHLYSVAVTDKGLISVVERCSFLKSLELLSLQTTDETLIAVGKSCPLLERLYVNEDFSDRGLCAVGEGCAKLKDLYLGSCSKISDRGLQAIAHGCVKLESLRVFLCSGFGTQGLMSIGRSCTALLELIVACYDVYIHEDAFIAVGRSCQRLQKLVIIDCSTVGDSAISNIASGCRNLKKLLIFRSPQVGDEGIINIGKFCKYLIELNIGCSNRVSDKSLIAIGKGCPLLEILGCMGCYNIGDAGIMAIARGCPRLTCLDATLSKLSDKALATLAECCPRLTRIKLTECGEITDAGLWHLVKNCTRLAACDIISCARITDLGLAIMRLMLSERFSKGEEALA